MTSDKPVAVASNALLAFHIPADLAEAFDDFVTAACAAIDCEDRGSWSDDERRIFEWMESDKWKANPGHQGTTHLVRRTLDGVVLRPNPKEARHDAGG